MFGISQRREIPLLVSDEGVAHYNLSLRDGKLSLFHLPSVVSLHGEGDLNISLNELIKFSHQCFGGILQKDENENLAECSDFIIARARGLLIDEIAKSTKEAATGLVDGVLAVSRENLSDVWANSGCCPGRYNSES